MSTMADASTLDQLRVHLAAEDTVIRSIDRPNSRDWAYQSVAGAALALGTSYPSAPLNAAERDIVNWAVVGARASAGRASGVFMEKQCFANALRLAISDRTGALQYCEGYVASVIPIHHAWCVIGGKVIDPTLRLGRRERGYGEWAGRWDRTLGVYPVDRAYLGIVFSDKRALLERLRRRSDLPILDDWRATWPVLRGERPCGMQGPDETATTEGAEA